MPLGICPECINKFHVHVLKDLGDFISCTECKAQLEIVGVDPIELDLAENDLTDTYDDHDYGDED